jgi:hypothetical protein
VGGMILLSAIGSSGKVLFLEKMDREGDQESSSTILKTALIIFVMEILI